MKLIESVRQEVGRLLDRYEKEDFNISSALMEQAGFDRKLSQENQISAGYSPAFFSFLVETLYSEALARGFVINSHDLIKKIPLTEYAYIGKAGSVETEHIKEAIPGVLIKKGLFFKVLSALDMSKTIEAYTKHLVITCDEFSEDPKSLLRYYSNAEIQKCSKMDFVYDLFEEELESKGNKSRIRKLKKQD